MQNNLGIVKIFLIELLGALNGRMNVKYHHKIHINCYVKVRYYSLHRLCARSRVPLVHIGISPVSS